MESLAMKIKYSEFAEHYDLQVYKIYEKRTFYRRKAKRDTRFEKFICGKS